MSKQQPNQPKVVHRPAPQPQPAAEKPQEPAQGEAKAPRIVTALAYLQTPEGWVSLRYTIQGDKVLKVEPSKPDLRVIAQENFKRDVANMLLDGFK